jgi:hypothetical protein
MLICSYKTTVAIILWNGGGYQFHHRKNGIDGVTVSVLVSSEVYRVPIGSNQRLCNWYMQHLLLCYFLTVMRYLLKVSRYLSKVNHYLSKVNRYFLKVGRCNQWNDEHEVRFLLDQNVELDFIVLAHCINFTTEKMASMV